MSDETTQVRFRSRTVSKQQYLATSEALRLQMEKTTKIEHELKLTMNSFLDASMKASQMSKDLNEGSKRVASLYKAVDELNDKLNSAVERADGLGQSFQRYRSACEAESRDLRSQVRK